MGSAEPCAGLEPELIDVALGELPPPSVQEHVAGCARCQQVLASHRAVWAAVAGLPAVRPDPSRRAEVLAAARGENVGGTSKLRDLRAPSRDVRSHVVRAAAEALAQRAPPQRRWPVVVALSIAAAAAAALGVSSVAADGEAPTPPPDVEPVAVVPLPVQQPLPAPRLQPKLKGQMRDMRGIVVEPENEQPPAPQVPLPPEAPRPSVANGDAGGSSAAPEHIAGQPVAPPRRLAVLVVPMDKGAEAQQVKLEADILEILGPRTAFIVRPTDELFGLPPADRAESALRRAETAFTNAKAAFEVRPDETAERKLRFAVKELTRAAAALTTCAHLCDALAMYAATLHARGDLEEAKLALLDLFALAPTYELDAKKYSAAFRALSAGRNAQLLGSIDVKSTPSGARVYLDGALVGHTPVQLKAVAVGSHLLRIERPGFLKWGTVVEVSPEEKAIAEELRPTPAYKAYDAVDDKLAVEAARDRGGAVMSGLADSLAVDLALVATLRDGGELVLSLFELKSGNRLSTKRAPLWRNDKDELPRLLGGLMPREP